MARMYYEMHAKLEDLIEEKAFAGDTTAMLAIAVLSGARTICFEIDRSLGTSQHVLTGTPGPAEMAVMDRRDQHRELLDVLRDLVDCFKDRP